MSIEAASGAAPSSRSVSTTRRVAGEVFDAAVRATSSLPVARARSAADAPAARSVVLAAVLDEADLTVIENVCSLPLNLAAPRARSRGSRSPARGWCCTTTTFRGSVPRPRRDPTSRPGPQARCTSRSTRARVVELAEHGVTAVEITNFFDSTRPQGIGPRPARALGFTDDEFVVLQPARAIRARTSRPCCGSPRRSRMLAAPRRVRFWLTGPAEDGYEDTLAPCCARRGVRTRWGSVRARRTRTPRPTSSSSRRRSKGSATR